MLFYKKQMLNSNLIQATQFYKSWGTSFNKTLQKIRILVSGVLYLDPLISTIGHFKHLHSSTTEPNVAIYAGCGLSLPC